MGILEKRLCSFDNIITDETKALKIIKCIPNNFNKLHFWDNLYKLYPWLDIGQKKNW